MREGLRRIACVALLVGLAAAVSAPTAAARHPRRAAPAALTLRPLLARPGIVLRTRVLRVRVVARRAMLVRLYVLSERSDVLTPGVVVTRTRTVRLRPRRTVVVRLPILAAARRELPACARLIDVRAIVLRGRRRVPVRAFFARRRLPRVRVRCARGPRRLVRRPGTGQEGAGGLNPRQGGASDPRTNPAQPYASCDPNDPAVCLQPWPNDLYSVAESSRVTGRRVNLDITATPRNQAGKPIDPSDINRNDGYSPGAPIVTRVPGMDNPAAFHRTGAVPVTDLARTYDDAQPVVVINTRTLQRQLIWTEIDANPSNPADVNLMIHPGVNLPENTRFIVALRNMRDSAGRILGPSASFRALRDRTRAPDATTEARRAHFEGLFATLAAAGIDRHNLYLAWDFTTASEQSLSERQLAIRNDAFRQLGDTNLADMRVQGRAPAYTVTRVTDFTPAQNPKTARQVEGTFTVPCYLNAPGCPSGSRFLYAPGETAGRPTFLPGNTMTARFTCNIPRVAMDRGGARPSLYGHGLFGSRGEVNQDQAQSMGAEHDFVYCATDWVGMACTDLPPSDQGGFTDLVNGLLNDVQNGRVPSTPNAPDCDVPTALNDEADLSNFPQLVDRVDQSFVNFMYLGRLLIHPDGFSANPAFRNAQGSVLDTRRLFYDGNSQGGIFGGSLIALESDLDRGVIGVPGMAYATLLQRSSDFGTGQPPNPNPTDPGSVLPQYAYPLYKSYPNELERQLILSLIQQMWDHSDPDGLAAHMTTNPLPDTPVHHVLMHVALGDHQVANVAAEAEARTIGARARVPWADRGRFLERDPTYGLAPIGSYPYDGSAIVLWDIGPLRTSRCAPGQSQCGTPPAPATNTPPSQGEDPHEAPRNAVAARAQKSAFMSIGGTVIDTCGSRPCYAGSWTGP